MIRGRVLYLVSIIVVILLTLAVLGIVMTFATRSPWILPFWGWLFVDLLAYIVSIITLLGAATALEGFIRNRVPIGLSHLKSSMISVGVGVIASTILIFAILAEILGADLVATLTLFALPFAVIPSFIAWLISPALINLSYGCKPDPYLQKIVDRVAARAGIKPPKAMIAEMPIPNAFAYSSPIMGRYVAVTRGLLDIMDEKELEAVIGHELGHHKHRDNAIMMLFGIIPSVIYFLGRYLMIFGIYSSRYTDGGERRRESSGSGLLLMLIGVILVAVSILIQLAVLALSRLREYYADAHGAKVTSPMTMSSALQALDRFYSRYRSARDIIRNSKMSAFFIYALAEPFIGLEELLSTHPPIYKRIEFLKTLTFTDLANA